MAEEVRQYNESLAEEQRQYNQSLAVKLANSSGGGGGSTGGDIAPVIAKEPAVVEAAKTGVAAAANAVKNNATKTSNDAGGIPLDLTVDMESVRALGYGDISAAKLDNLVRKGIVEEYESGGQIKFRKVVK